MIQFESDLIIISPHSHVCRLSCILWKNMLYLVPASGSCKQRLATLENSGQSSVYAPATVKHEKITFHYLTLPTFIYCLASSSHAART